MFAAPSPGPPGSRRHMAGRPGIVATVPARSMSAATGIKGAGEIDYRLARQALIAQYRGGRIARNEVCDAHPELRRNASSLGLATDRPCPICASNEMVLLTYVFGPRLPKSGRCLSTKGELAKIARRRGHFTGYVVEVCTDCWWNHLMRSFPIPGRTGP